MSLVVALAQRTSSLKLIVIGSLARSSVFEYEHSRVCSSNRCECFDIQLQPTPWPVHDGDEPGPPDGYDGVDEEGIFPGQPLSMAFSIVSQPDNAVAPITTNKIVINRVAVLCMMNLLTCIKSI